MQSDAAANGGGAMLSGDPSAGAVAQDRASSAGAVLPLVCAAHFASHFFQFLVPSLLPALRSEYGASYAELGSLVTTFYAASAACQVPAGSVVDRLGAGATLVGGLALTSCAFAAIAFAPPLWAVLALMAAAGVGNSVFHPAGYTLLSGAVRQDFVGRAFSFHSVAGMAGYASVPAFTGSVTAIAPLRAAILIPAISGLILSLALAARFRASPAARPTEPGHGRGPRPSVRSLLSPAILSGFGFFAFSAIPWIGAATFLPAVLNGVFGTPVGTGLDAVAAQLLASVPGTLIGGWLADATPRRFAVVAAGLAAAGAAFLCAGNFPLPAAALVSALGFAGLVEGMTTPSRDKMLKEAAPDGATGRAFAIAYAGYDLGSAATPALLGLLLDLGRIAWIIPTIAASYGAMILFSSQRPPVRRQATATR